MHVKAHHFLALLGGEEVLDQEDVRIVADQLRPGRLGVDLVKVGLRIVAFERPVGVSGQWLNVPQLACVAPVQLCKAAHSVAIASEHPELHE
eukprot:1665125-Prymnesium_polylepis.3